CRLAYAEAEAARLIGLKYHQLRDERLRGCIQASQIVGRRIRYLRNDLLDYLTSRRWQKGQSRPPAVVGKKSSRQRDGAIREDSPDMERLALKKVEIRVLEVFAESAPVLMLQEEVAAAIRRTRGAVWPILVNLRRLGLIYRPRGPREGETISEAGLKLL